MKVTFKIDMISDTEITLQMLYNLPHDPAGAIRRLEGRGIPNSIAHDFLSGKTKQAKIKFIKLIKESYPVKIRELEKAKEALEKFYSQDTIDLFAKRLEALLGITCNKTFTCIISAFFSTSAWYGKVFSVWYKHLEEGIIHQILAIELVESLVHCYINQHYPNYLTEYQRWALSEAIAFNVVYIDEYIKQKLWPEIGITYDNANYYPQIKEFIKDIGQVVFDNDTPTRKLQKVIFAASKWL